MFNLANCRLHCSFSRYSLTRGGLKQAAALRGLTYMFATFLLSAVAFLGVANPERVEGGFIATAYSVTGITASGEYTHRHVVAADPTILPMGTRIKIRRAGKYSGEYVVADTGEKIVGRKLDIYLPSTVECMKFGKKPVRVKVIELGDGTHLAAKQADQAVKKDVAQDVAKGAVGNAATEADWATKGGAPKTAKTTTSSAPTSTAPK